MDETVINRIMPHNSEAEAAVVGAMLMDNDAIPQAADILTQEDFYQKSYGAAFEAMRLLSIEGKPIDATILQERLKEMGAADEISSLAFMNEALDAVSTSANIRYYAGIVYEKAMMRKLVRLCEGLANDCYKGETPLQDVLQEAEGGVYNLIEKGESKKSRDIMTIVLDSLDRIEEVSKSPGGVTGIPTGFRELDDMLSGLQPSNLVIIAARPSVGKTALALNIAQHAAFRKNLSVAVFSLEMASEELMNRFFAMEGNIDATHIKDGSLTNDEWTKLIEASDIAANSRLNIEEVSNLTVSQIRSRCRKIKLEKGLDLIVIDYLQLMSGEGGRKNDNRQQEITEISRGLKQIARELKIPVLALSQLNRSVETRGADSKPRLSDLRESGAIEQDADVVMFIDKNPEEPNEADIIVAKQRNGPIGSVRLNWIGKFVKFTNPPRRSDVQ